MKHLIGIRILFLSVILLAWQIPYGKTQVEITGKSTGTVTRTNTNAVDGKTTLEDGSNKIRVADPFYSSQTLTVNSTTPSIASYSAFKTANSSTTAITTLNGISDSTYIKVVFIRIGDIYTSFVDSDHFDCNGTNLVPSSGDLIRAVWSGLTHPNGKWLIEKLDSFTFEDMIIESGMVYDVTHPKYGAIVGDNLCDLVAIQVTLDSINANGGGTLFFPPGTYSYDSDNGKLTVYSNTKVSGYGAKFDQIKGGEVLFFTDGDSDIVFEGMEIDGNAVIDGIYDEHHHGISVNNSKRITIRGAYMHNLSGDGIYFADTDYGYVMNCTIISTHLADAPYLGRNGIAVVEGDHFEFIGNILEGGYPANIDIEPNTNLFVTNVIISNNIIRGGEYGVSLNAGAANTTLDSVKVINNIITIPVKYGVRVQDVTHWDISGNTINSTGFDGIQIRPSVILGRIFNNDIYNSGQGGGSGYAGILVNQGSENIAILSNRVWNSEASGIRIAGGSGTENNWITVKDNVCWNNDRNSGGSNAGIYINYTDSSYVNGNFCYDTQNTPTQTYGFILTQMDVCFIGNDNRGYNNDTRLFSVSSTTKESIGGIVSYSWYVDDVAANVSTTQMFIGGTAGNMVVPFDCYIIGMSVSLSATVNTDTININIDTNESQAGFLIILDGEGGDDIYAYQTQLADSNSDMILSAGDRIRVTYNTTSGLSPDGSLDMVVTLLLRY